MTSGMVEDTLLAHASGLRLLLGPADDRSRRRWPRSPAAADAGDEAIGC